MKINSLEFILSQFHKGVLNSYIAYAKRDCLFYLKKKPQTI